eukprot:4606431-Amphidinium_carterae.1
MAIITVGHGSLLLTSCLKSELRALQLNALQLLAKDKLTEMAFEWLYLQGSLSFTRAHFESALGTGKHLWDQYHTITGQLVVRFSLDVQRAFFLLHVFLLCMDGRQQF